MSEPSAQRIPLGPFELHARIAKGGMGEIWRGVHRHQNVPVAVKVLTAEQMREPGYQADFLREAEAVAGLTHPGIILLFDHGFLSEEVGERAGGALVPGSPYLVMEYASRGSLDSLTPPLTWTDFRRIVTALLQALAHAHSRGLIHLDIKPGNVLLGSSDDPRPQLKLTDFGLVHALDRQQPCSTGASPHGTVEQARGTPWYMAPEQICGHWRDYGPWTDLYALGILAWELVCGSRPFEGKSARAIGRRHLDQPLPRLQPIVDVPPDLESWLGGMLDKQPSRRFQRASDALHALLALGDPAEPVTVVRPIPVAPEEPDTVVGPAPKPPPKSHKLSESSDQITQSLDGSPPKNALLEPAIDLRSRSVLRTPDPGCPEEEPPPPPGMAGAGLGLFHLRRIPFIGRRHEREQLWRALRNVYTTGRPQVVVLRGAAGLGQSRLASWLCERSHEAGVATFLRAVHDSEGRSDTGLPRMFADHFRSVGLRRWAIKLRLGKLLARLGIHDLATLEETSDFLQLASPVPGDQQTSSYRARPDDRRRLTAKLLAQLTRDRALVVWLDDAHYGHDGVELVHYMLEQQFESPCPLLFLLTICDESLGERPRTDALVTRLSEHPRVETLPIHPLSRAETEQLVSQLLDLEPPLHKQVVDKVSGNPMLATALLGDWIDRGLLHPGPSGFVLARGTSIRFPDDLHALWLARLDRHNLPRDALELAATIGHEFSTKQLQRVCAAARVDMAPDLLDRLHAAHLCVAQAQGWRFAHPMLRECLLRSAREHGRLRDHNLACAAVIKLEKYADTSVTAERLAGHLLAAEEYEAASKALLTAARHRHRCGEPGQAVRLLELYEQALRRLHLPSSDPRWGVGWALHADVLVRSGDFARARKQAQRAVQASVRSRNLRTRAGALDTLAFLARREGDCELAIRYGQQALSLHDELQDPKGRASVLLNLGHSHLDDDDLERAVLLFEESRSCYAGVDDQLGNARSLLALGHAFARQSKRELAVEAYTRGREIFEQIGNSFLVLACDHGLSQVQN